MNLKTVLLMVLAAAAGALGMLLWQRPADAPPAPAPAAAPASAVPAAAAASVPPPQAGPKFPVETVEPSAALAVQDIPAQLADLLGSKAVSAFMQTDAFPRRFAATVDNLARTHAPAAVWPVLPTPGRFTVTETPAGPVIAEENSARYAPFVLLAETVDVGMAVGLYARMYPLLQQAWRELGYPQGHFNDRLVEVIDLLLATPAVEYPLRLQLTEVKGPIPSERPWVRYAFADPALERLAAGQKILLRVGPVNQRRLRNRLAELREQLAKKPAAR